MNHAKEYEKEIFNFFMRDFCTIIMAERTNNARADCALCRNEEKNKNLRVKSRANATKYLRVHVIDRSAKNDRIGKAREE